MRKLKKVVFDNVGFRNLRSIELDIKENINIIAGHNGIGKSTILGLIANCSELKNEKTILNQKFRSDFSELFFLDYNDDFAEREGGACKATLIYSYDDIEVTTACVVTGNYKKIIKKENYKKFMVKAITADLTPTQKAELDNDHIYVHRMRIIPRTQDSNGDTSSAKLEIPTLYLGMSRINPIGEFSWENINHKNTSTQEEDVVTFIYDLFDKIIPSDYAEDHTVYSHDFKNTNKKSCVPNFGHSSLSISLGQDSLSSIISALASFYKLKLNLGDDYMGGILLIDEIEAGLHPRAQKALINQLKKLTKSLNLQIICTSHSLTIIKEVLDENVAKKYRKNDVIYLVDTKVPRPMPDPTYSKIKSDMLLEDHIDIPTVVKPDPTAVYFEDLEALDFFKALLSFKKLNNSLKDFGRDLDLIAVQLGCTNLIKLNKTPHYKKSIIILDSDVAEDSQSSVIKKSLSEGENVVLLPCINSSSSYYRMPPDKIAYAYLLDKNLNALTNIDFWHDKTSISFSTDRYHALLKDINKYYTASHIATPKSIEEVNRIPRGAMKAWYNATSKILEDNKIFELWAEENKEECDNFIERLTIAIDKL